MQITINIIDDKNKILFSMPLKSVRQATAFVAGLISQQTLFTISYEDGKKPVQ